MVILKRSFNTQTISQFQWSALFFGHNIAFLAFKFALISWCFLLFFRRQQTDDATNCKFKCRSSCNCLWKWVWPTLRPASDCPAVRLSGCPFVRQFSRQFATRPAQSHQRATNNVKLALYNFSRGKAGDGKCEGRQLRRLPWRPKLSAVCEQLETYESCLPNNNKINCARREKLGAKRGLRVFRLRCR